MEDTDSTLEPLPPKEQNPWPAPSVIDAATYSERSQSPHQEELSCTAAVNEAAALPEPNPPLSSQKSTSAAQESSEPKPSNVEQKLHQQPCSSRQRKIPKVRKSREYDYNFRFHNDKVENYVCNECFIFQTSECWLGS